MGRRGHTDDRRRLVQDPERARSLRRLVKTKRDRLDVWREQLKKDGTTKWHPEGSDSIAAYVDHEIGHALDVLAGDGTRAYYGITQRQLMHKLYDQHARAGTMESALSRYALKKYDWSNNPLEMLAEAWSEYLNNPAPRALAREIGEEIIKIISGGT